MGSGRLDLEPLLNPRTVGVVGASTRRTRGTKVLQNLRAAGFAGRVYPVSHSHDRIADLVCYPSVAEVPERLDTLLVAVPGEGVPALLEDARAAGTRSAVILSSGFAEVGGFGLERHRALERLVESGMPICGPNCFGLINAATGAAVFSGSLPQPLRTGTVAVLSQSGGFANLIANTLVEDRGLGLRYLVSCGNQIGPRIEDYLAFFVADPDVHVIACYAEQVRSADDLLAVGAAAAAAGTTVVMLKSGRSASAQAAVASHTGSVAGSADIADAVLRKAGIVVATSLDELIETAALAAVGDVRRIGRRVLVVSGGGGETSHAADAAERAGAILPQPRAETLAALTAVLPAYARAANPLDVTGTMFEKPELFPAVLQAVSDDDTVDVIALNLGLRAVRPDQPRREGFVEAIARLPDLMRAKIIAYGPTATGEVDRDSIAALAQLGVPSLMGSDNIMRAVVCLAGRNERLGEIGELRVAEQRPRRSVAWPGADAVTQRGAWRLLAEAGVPMAPTREVAGLDAAVAAAEELGYPVALKVAGLAISHKSDLGGVALDLRTREDVTVAYESIHRALASGPGVQVPLLVQPMAAPGVELLVGIIRDAALGPAVVVGLGGVFVEIFADSAVDVPPVSLADAARLVRRLRGFPLLAGARGTTPSDVDAVERLLVVLGELAHSMPDHIHAVDLNPVIVHETGITCVDLWVDVRS